MADVFMWASIVVGGANAVLAALLLVVYGGVYAKTKAPFSLALLAFSGAFLAHNLLLLYSYATMMGLLPDAVAPYLLGVGILEAGGLGAILWSATR